MIKLLKKFWWWAWAGRNDGQRLIQLYEEAFGEDYYTGRKIAPKTELRGKNANPLYDL